MTESTQIQTTENNNTGVAKMDPAPVSPSPSEQQYALKWNDFQTSILSSFRHLRDEEDFVDVTLACDQRSFTAHKVVLSACSPYFRKLLKANPCKHPIVILRDVRAEDVENLLRFMYNGEVNIGHEQLSDFLKTAQLLQVRGLADVTGPSSKTSTSTVNPLSSSTPAVQELKASPTSTSLPWELSENRPNHLTPPPQKRIKSADLYRAQHGISPERLLIDKDLPPDQHPLHRERDRTRDRSNSSRETSRDRDRSLELRDSLLGQALESGHQLPTGQKHPDLASLQAQSTGEDSNSSDTEPSDRGDGQLDVTMDSMNGSMDNTRSHSFPFLGLQGIPGLIPGPSGIHGADNFVSRRIHEMRVRATDPRPCPKCGKIYRSAHTLRTHLEDKHTVCPGYRCVLCGTVAKSRNSLHSHMSRQHRGISTKDLPVLPMPNPFDPDLASRLLAKAGVKVSPAELRARASPTSGTRRGDSKLDLRGQDDDTDDPEDLTTGNNNNNNSSSRYSDGLLGYGHSNTTITRIPHDAMSQKSSDGLSSKDHLGGASTPLPPTSGAPGQSLLDTYLQFITENPFGLGMSQEHAAAALHAAKMAQLNAMGHGLDKLPPGLLPPHLDLSKISHNNTEISRHSQSGGLGSNSADSRGNSGNVGSGGSHSGNAGNIGSNSVTIEPAINRHEVSPPRQHTATPLSNNGPDIRRDSSEPMDLGLDNNQSGSNNDGANSDGEDANYSEDEGVHNT
ncbi:protein abrupt isoform X2 [Hermetia illucens]|uniref:protein abrupt isoform X2 n=1 Tax=Hermetia illucens TaxID=343691 RepID=UPI0018CC16D8|nr:protein abrupt isoform X2 [Hermetia illucens]